MLIIRLSPTRPKNRVTFRIVVSEKRSKLCGKNLDDLGYYNAIKKPAQIEINREKLDKWIKQGAIVSQKVKQIIQ